MNAAPAAVLVDSAEYFDSQPATPAVETPFHPASTSHATQKDEIQPAAEPREEQVVFEPTRSAPQPVVEAPPEAPRTEVTRSPDLAVAQAAEPPQLKLEWPSDLVQIETDPHKAQASVHDEAPVAARTPRVRPLPPPVSNEPLVQVETHRRESA